MSTETKEQESLMDRLTIRKSIIQKQLIWHFESRSGRHLLSVTKKELLELLIMVQTEVEHEMGVHIGQQ